MASLTFFLIANNDVLEFLRHILKIGSNF